MKKKFEDGLYNISNEEYHSAEGFSRSQLMSLSKSPYHFWYEHLSGLTEKKASTDAMILGNAVHTLLLQPDLFNDEYIVMPPMDRRTTAGKEIYAAFMAESQGKIILTAEQNDKAFAIRDGVQEHKIFHELTNKAQFEQSIFWTDKETGIQFKARPDIWSSRMIVDLKTTKDANVNRFKYDALSKGYYLQAGMMFEACKALDKPFKLFVTLAIEKDAPYVPVAFTMREEALDFGIEQFNNYKRQLKECLDSGKWPGYAIQELGLPYNATYTLGED